MYLADALEPGWSGSSWLACAAVRGTARYAGRSRLLSARLHAEDAVWTLRLNCAEWPQDGHDCILRQNVRGSFRQNMGDGDHHLKSYDAEKQWPLGRTGLLPMLCKNSTQHRGRYK